MLKSNPGRNQRWMEGEECQEAHGQGHLPAGGGHHHGDDQEEGIDHDKEVMRGVPGEPDITTLIRTDTVSQHLRTNYRRGGRSGQSEARYLRMERLGSKNMKILRNLHRLTFVM